MKHVIALVLFSVFTFAQDAQSPWKLSLGASGLEFYEKNDGNQTVPGYGDQLSSDLNFSIKADFSFKIFSFPGNT